MATIAPPTRPIFKSKTDMKPRSYYTIHAKPNDVFTLRINDKMKTAVVGFKEIDDAIFIGSMIESYFIQQKEWPETGERALVLPTSQSDVLHHLYVQKWAFDELKMTCTKNILDLISVDSIVNTKSGYSFSGEAYQFEARIEFYQERFNELLTKN